MVTNIDRFVIKRCGNIFFTNDGLFAAALRLNISFRLSIACFSSITRCSFLFFLKKKTKITLNKDFEVILTLFVSLNQLRPRFYVEDISYITPLLAPKDIQKVNHLEAVIKIVIIVCFNKIIN